MNRLSLEPPNMPVKLLCMVCKRTTASNEYFDLLNNQVSIIAWGIIIKNLGRRSAIPPVEKFHYNALVSAKSSKLHLLVKR